MYLYIQQTRTYTYITNHDTSRFNAHRYLATLDGTQCVQTQFHPVIHALLKPLPVFLRIQWMIRHLVQHRMSAGAVSATTASEDAGEVKKGKKSLGVIYRILAIYTCGT